MKDIIPQTNKDMHRRCGFSVSPGLDGGYKASFNEPMAKKRAPILQAVMDQFGGLAVATACGVTPQAVSQWEVIPVQHVLAIERLTGIPREALRADLFGAPRPRPPGMGQMIVSNPS